MNLATVYFNISKAAPRFFFAGTLYPTEEAAKAAAGDLKGYIGTYSVTLPEDLLK
jgi:hypothetical protein